MHMMQLSWCCHSLLGSPLGVASCLNAHSSMLPVGCPFQHDIKDELNMIMVMTLPHIHTCTAQHLHNPWCLTGHFSSRACADGAFGCSSLLDMPLHCGLS